MGGLRTNLKASRSSSRIELEVLLSTTRTEPWREGLTVAHRE